MNEPMRRAVASGARTDDIRDLARQNGMQTLKEHAMFLMAQGHTSVDEVLKNVVVEY